MRLTTYNFLTTKAMKGVKVGYPLKLTIQKQATVESEFNGVFIERLMPRLNWAVIRMGAEQAGLAADIPEEQPEKLSEAEGLLEKLHHLLLEVDVVEGELQCPETGRIFKIKNGIPNMLLNEDEV